MLSMILLVSAVLLPYTVFIWCVSILFHLVTNPELLIDLIVEVAMIAPSILKFAAGRMGTRVAHSGTHAGASAIQRLWGTEVPDFSSFNNATTPLENVFVDPPTDPTVYQACLTMALLAIGYLGGLRSTPPIPAV